MAFQWTDKQIGDIIDPNDINSIAHAVQDAEGIPSFDLTALGLPTAMLNGDAVSVETDTSAILEAINKGQIKISMSVKLSESIDAIRINAISGAAMLSENAAVITSVTREMSMAIVSTVSITANSIGVLFTTLREVPLYTADDAKKVLSVSENGSYLGWSEIESGATPVFDLSAMGLPNIPYGDRGGVELETDTTEIMAALEKGAVTFKITANAPYGDTLVPVPFVVTVNPIFTDGYICGACLPIMTDLDCVLILVGEGYISAVAYPISIGGDTTPPTSIDLSGLESSGQIIETYADGSTKITQLEFDTDGNPTKITDGDGNVTNLIW